MGTEKLIKIIAPLIIPHKSAGLPVNLPGHFYGRANSAAVGGEASFGAHMRDHRRR
jgi:hypothetical protein